MGEKTSAHLIRNISKVQKLDTCCFSPFLVPGPPLYSAILGTRTQKISSKIIGGSEAASGAYPYACSLQMSKEHFCGGTIYTAKWVLTAASCMENLFSATLVDVVVGTNDAQSGGTRYNVYVFIPHHLYEGHPLYRYDIGLIRVTGSIVFSDLVKPITLKREVIEDRPTVELAGWGKVSVSSSEITFEVMSYGKVKL